VYTQPPAPPPPPRGRPGQQRPHAQQAPPQPLRYRPLIELDDLSVTKRRAAPRASRAARAV
jgi:hypothetical protein